MIDPPPTPSCSICAAWRDGVRVWWRSSGRKRAGRAAGWSLLGAGVAAGTWLTLSQSGRVPAVPGLPEPLVDWMNSHGRLRNVPAYFLLTIPAVVLAAPRRTAQAALAIGALAAALEFAQLGIQSRQFDWWDIFLSWLGAAVAYAAWMRVEPWAARVAEEAGV